MSDPLQRTGPQAEYELFMRFIGQAREGGFTPDHAIAAAINVIINGIRMKQGTWLTAEALLNELVGKLKTILREQYDPLGHRRSVLISDVPSPIDIEKLLKN